MHVATALADLLGVDADTLVGRRYSCIVVADRFGETSSGFLLLSD